MYAGRTVLLISHRYNTVRDAELTETFDIVDAQSIPPISHTDRRFADQVRRFPDDRALMLRAEYHGRVVGGAFAFRRSPASGSAAALRLVAVQPAHQYNGQLQALREWRSQRLAAPSDQPRTASPDPQRRWRSAHAVRLDPNRRWPR